MGSALTSGMLCSAMARAMTGPKSVNAENATCARQGGQKGSGQGTGVRRKGGALVGLVGSGRAVALSQSAPRPTRLC